MDSMWKQIEEVRVENPLEYGTCVPVLIWDFNVSSKHMSLGMHARHSSEGRGPAAFPGRPSAGLAGGWSDQMRAGAGCAGKSGLAEGGIEPLVRLALPEGCCWKLLIWAGVPQSVQLSRTSVSQRDVVGGR